MILADTSVWIYHMRGRRSRFSAALEDDLVLVHPFVIGGSPQSPCSWGWRTTNRSDARFLPAVEQCPSRADIAIDEGMIVG